MLAGNFLTGDSFAMTNFEPRQNLALGQDIKVTYGTFAEKSSEDSTLKEWCGKLTGDSSF